jgi:hypothetical protein
VIEGLPGGLAADVPAEPLEEGAEEGAHGGFYARGGRWIPSGTPASGCVCGLDP